MDRYLKTKDIETMLGIGKNKAYKLIQLDGFPKIKIGKQYFIPEGKLQTYLDKHVGTKIIID